MHPPFAYNVNECGQHLLLTPKLLMPSSDFWNHFICLNQTFVVVNSPADTGSTIALWESGGHVSTFLEMNIDMRWVSNKWGKVRYLGHFFTEWRSIVILQRYWQNKVSPNSKIFAEMLIHVSAQLPHCLEQASWTLWGWEGVIFHQ